MVILTILFKKCKQAIFAISNINLAWIIKSFTIILYYTL